MPTQASRRRPDARSVWPPEPGHFRLRLVRRGWGVPAQIIQTSRGAWLAVIDGLFKTPHLDPAYAEDVARIWHGGERITQAEYERLTEIRRTAAPGHPALTPYQPMDARTLPPIIPDRTPIP